MKQSRSLLFLSLWLCIAANVQSEDLKQLINWDELSASGKPLPGSLVTNGTQKLLRIVNTNPLPLNVILTRIEKPGLEFKPYGVRGDVRHRNVEGVGFLEMWSEFAATNGKPGGRFFSRTLGESGPMGRLIGTSDWRQFLLPFQPEGASGPPTSLEIRLQLPGRGEVEIGPLSLLQFSDGNFFGSVVGAGWWSERWTGIAGGIAGGAIGCFGSLLSLLASRGKARKFVMTSIGVLISLGLGIFAMGLAALLHKQPWHLTFGLLLFGGLLMATFPVHYTRLRKQYDENELRKMAALDAEG